jgi:hypothetical protein
MYLLVAPMILEVFFPAEEKRSMRTQSFRQGKTFHHLCARPPDIS